MSSKKEIKTVLMLIILVLCSVFLSSGCLFMLLVMMFEGAWWLIGVALFAVPLFFTIKKIIKIRKAPYPAKAKKEDIIKTVLFSDTQQIKPSDTPVIPETLKNQKIAFFDKYGVLQSVYPNDPAISLYDNRHIANEANYYVINGKQYDLTNPESFNSIPTPLFQHPEFVVFDLSYVMKMHTAYIDNKELAVPFALKTVELMTASEILWQTKDYFTVAGRLMELGEFDSADIICDVAKQEREKFDKWKYNYFVNVISNNELVQASAHNATCGICSIYQNRIYSVNGKDKRFPKLPKEFIKYGGFHNGCRHTFSPVFFYDGYKIYDYVIDENSGEHKEISYDAIEYSNRPFVDTRTVEQIKLYEDNKKSFYPIPVEQEYQKLKIRYKERLKNVREFELVKDLLPKLAPKSLSGYSRMKSGNTKNYQKIVEAMRNSGYPNFAENENITKEI